MVGVDTFVGELRKFFTDLRKFLQINLKEYTLAVEDDNKRDRLVEIIKKLEKEALGLLPQNDEGTMDETYDDPYADRDLGRNEGEKEGVVEDEEGEIEDTYDNPDNDREIMMPAPPKGTGGETAAVTEKISKKEKKLKETEMKEKGADDNISRSLEELTKDEGTMDETYDNPYADRDLGKHEGEKEGVVEDEEGEIEDTYDNPDNNGQIMTPTPPKGTGGKTAAMTEKISKKEKKMKEKKMKKEKKKTDDNVSRTMEELSEGSIQTVTVADMKNCEISGLMRKQNHKSRHRLEDKTYWCAIKEGVLHYFKEKTKKYKGHIVLKDYTASETDKKCVFQLACPGRSDIFFATEELHQWVSYINTSKLPVQEPEAEPEELRFPAAPTTDEEEEQGIDEDIYETFQDQFKATQNMEELYTDTLAATNDSQSSPALPPRHEHLCDPGGVGSKEAPPTLPARDGLFSPVDTRPPTKPPLPSTVQQSDELYDDTYTTSNTDEDQRVNEDLYDILPDQLEATENMEEIYTDTLAATNDSQSSPALPPRHEHLSRPGGVGNKEAPPIQPAKDGLFSPIDTRPPTKSPVSLPPTVEQSDEFYSNTNIMDGEDDDESAPPLPPPPPTTDILGRKPEPGPTSSPQPPPRKSSLPIPTPPSQNFEAMHYGLWACEALGQYELEFPRGACIEVINKDEYGNRGWWVGKLNKKVGLVPKDYLSPVYKQV